MFLKFKNSIFILVINYYQKMKTSKRAFLILIAIITSACPGSVGQHNDAVIERHGETYVRLSLNAYSFKQMLYDNLDDASKGINLFDVLDFCAENNIDAIDPTGYFFPGYPEAPADDYINKFKRRAFQLGIDISGTGVRNDFASPDPEIRATSGVIALQFSENQLTLILG